MLAQRKKKPDESKTKKEAINGCPRGKKLPKLSRGDARGERKNVDRSPSAAQKKARSSESLAEGKKSDAIRKKKSPTPEVAAPLAFCLKKKENCSSPVSEKEEKRYGDKRGCRGKEKRRMVLGL